MRLCAMSESSSAPGGTCEISLRHAEGRPVECRAKITYRLGEGVATFPEGG